MKKIRLKITVSEKSQKSRFYREKREKYKKIHHMVLQNHDTMSVSEREQTKFVHRERFKSKRNQAGETGKWDRNYIWNVIRESAEI